nr:hypothetical protein Q903MT_gene1958 [Picea sitchensis]
MISSPGTDMTKPGMGISSLSPGNRISITIFYLFLSQESIYDLSQQPV